MIRYKIEEICGDWAIYEVRETETEGGAQAENIRTFASWIGGMGV